MMGRLRASLTKANITVAVFFILYVAIMFVHTPGICIVDGTSMTPTLKDKQVLLCAKPTQIERGDIVIIKLDDGTKIIKRVIGIPNDWVHIHDGRVYVNETIFDDRQTDYAGLVVIPFPLVEGRYFVLGDNRGDSLDSRYPYVSIINEDQIIRKVFFVE